MTALPSQPAQIWDLPDEVAVGDSSWRPWAPDEDGSPSRMGVISRTAGLAAIIVFGFILRVGIEAATANLVALDSPADETVPACVQVAGGEAPRTGSAGLASTFAAVLRYL